MIRIALALLQLDIISVFGTYYLPKVLWDSDGNCNDSNSVKNVSIPGDINYAICINSKILSKSILNFGDLSHKTKTKLKLRQCLKFSAFGGSITCGFTGSSPASPDDAEHPDIETAWPNQFILRYNEILPCVDASHLPSKHTLSVRCQGGFHTGLWIEEIMKRESDFLDYIKSADIVIFETAVNDISQGLGGKPGQEDATFFVKQQTELLLRMIKSINPNVSPLWLGASTRNRGWQNEYPREGDASHIHIDVLKRYNYPQLSVIDGLGPFYSAEALNWFRKTYIFDPCCHPTNTGHKIIGYLLSQFLMLHFYDSKISIFSQNEVLTDPSLLPLYFISKEHMESHIKTKSLYIDLTTPNRSKYELPNSSGWSLKSDKKGKPPGYIAHEVGSKFSLQIKGYILKQHFTSYMINVKALKSYENIGAFQLTIILQSFKKSFVTNKIEIDCEWKHKASEPDIIEFELDKSKWINISDLDSMELNFEVIKKPSRLVNKVKLFLIMIY